MRSIIRFVGMLVLPLSASLAATANDASPKTALDIPKPLVVELESHADAISDNLWDGFNQLSNGSDSASLLEVVAVLRGFGYGTVSQSDASGGRGRGGAGRGAGGQQAGGGGRGRGGAARGSRGGDAGSAGRGDSDGGGGHAPPTSVEETRQRFDARDTIRDGVWEKDEINGYMQGQPASNDGKVTFEEYATAWEELRSRMGGGGGNRGGGHGGGGHGGGGHGGGRASSVSLDAAFLVSLDTDRDRKLQRSELSEPVARELSRQLTDWVKRDADGDGLVSAQEYAVATASETDGSADTPVATKLPRFVSRMDTDRDGSVSLGEALASASSRLDQQTRAIAVCLGWKQIDADKNGSIEPAELQALDDQWQKIAAALAVTAERPLPTDQLYARLQRLPLSELMGDHNHN
ncbi:hypothetical protein NHH03_06080 [Stieleria sp. TO1_6]|uniref:hypothetical protein n=1 Tax=Stieleria tagensis TaxID=2956795 RepID=UPI00209B6B64|nr:hypothetical protein [Stieleria tagensis]MCO8121299.1 hypothetical protein [Stieleria tagensis]